LASLHLNALSKAYSDVPIVNNVSLTVGDGEFVSLLGPSGCGKTTILRMVAGLLSPTSGTVAAGGQDITNLPSNKRQIGLVFQSYALFPHMTVFENVAFGLRRRGVRGKELEDGVADALRRVQLSSVGPRYPRQLSGGQQQRIALARAIAYRPRILLFDEPLSNLDAQLREDVQIEIKRLQNELKITSIFVTHDQQEALSMSDRVCILAKGEIQQFATPEEIYHNPANAFVAGFIGRPNRLRGAVMRSGPDGAHLRLEDGADVVTSRPGPNSGNVNIVVRQEAIGLTPHRPPSGPNRFEATVVLRIFVGAQVQYVIKLSSGLELIASVTTASALGNFSPGDSVMIELPPDAIFYS
jgi:ABC-type Fe3+/spermidine/putrescine transport system ATPase subunit